MTMLRDQQRIYTILQSYVGMGGKGTVTPLLKGKVRIPPPAGHFIDPPCLKKKNY